MPAISPRPSSYESAPLSKANSRVLRLNVGFLLKEGVGTSRDFVFDEAAVEIAGDLQVFDLRGVINFTRTPQGLYAQGTLQATIDDECARCLTGYRQPVTMRLGELYHYPPETAPAEALTVGDDVHLDLAPIVREGFLLSIPMNGACRPDCLGLCPRCGANLNEGPCDCADDETDPRWEGLTALLKEEPPDQE